MKASVIIQARMGSSRLPGKVMKKIVGMPMIGLIIKRLKRAKNCEKIIVATSKNPENKILVDYLKKNKVLISLGSENDVLSRYYKAATEHKCKTIVKHPWTTSLGNKMISPQWQKVNKMTVPNSPNEGTNIGNA